MKSYIVRIYRGERGNPQSLVGIVEEVGMDGKMAFTNFEELWDIFNSIKNKPNQLTNGGDPVVRYEYESEKRAEVRTKKEIPLAFVHRGNLAASTVDVCKNGFCIKIPERTPLTIGDVMDFKMGHLGVKAEVRWFDHKADPPLTHAGFQIMDGRLNIKGLK